MSVEELNDKIIAQGNKVRDLKAAKADKNAVKAEVDNLLALKAEFKAAHGSDWKPGVDLGGAKENKAPEVKVSTVYLGGGISDDEKKILLDAAVETLDLKVQSCGDFIRKLKQEKATKDIIEREVAVLILLKELYKKKTGADWKPKSAEPPKEKKEEAKPAVEKADG